MASNSASTISSVLNRIQSDILGRQAKYTYFLLLLGLFYLYRRLKRDPRISPQGRFVLITGCDSGFGNLAAKRFHSLGFRVIANCYSESGAAQLGEDCPQMTVLVFDVTNPQQVTQVVQSILTLTGSSGLWGLVNNAGISTGAFVEFSSMEDFSQTMNVNFLAHVRMVKELLPALKRAKGRIVNVTSVLGRTSTPACSPYCTSKHALESFSDSLRLEMSGFGVKVSMIEPGYMNTNLVKTGTDAARSRIESQGELKNEYLKVYPHIFDPRPPAKLGDPQLVVDAMLQALTSTNPKARYVVGNDARYFFVPMSILPTCITDRIWLKMLKMT